MLQHLHLGRNDVELFARFLAHPVQRALATQLRQAELVLKDCDALLQRADPLLLRADLLLVGANT